MNPLLDVTSYPAASATAVKPGNGVLTEIVPSATHWTYHLFSFTSSRDAGFQRQHDKIEQTVSAAIEYMEMCFDDRGATRAKAKRTPDTLQTRRLSFGTAGLFALWLASVSSTPASARDYPYCVMTPAHMMLCAFDTMQQCKETASGLPRECLRDPFWDDRTIAKAFAYQPLHPHSKIRR